MSVPVPVKRGRGRPRKDGSAAVAKTKQEEPPAKRKRGSTLTPGEDLVPCPHPSVLTKVTSPPFDACGTQECGCNKYHCPLCPERKYEPSSLTALQIHYKEVHTRHALLFRSFLMAQCCLPCKTSPHFHCPLCGDLFQRKALLSPHLTKCRQEQPSTYSSHHAWSSPRAARKHDDTRSEVAAPLSTLMRPARPRNAVDPHKSDASSPLVKTRNIHKDSGDNLWDIYQDKPSDESTETHTAADFNSVLMENFIKSENEADSDRYAEANLGDAEDISLDVNGKQTSKNMQQPPGQSVPNLNPPGAVRVGAVSSAEAATPDGNPQSTVELLESVEVSSELKGDDVALDLQDQLLQLATRAALVTPPGPEVDSVAGETLPVTCTQVDPSAVMVLTENHGAQSLRVIQSPLEQLAEASSTVSLMELNAAAAEAALTSALTVVAPAEGNAGVENMEKVQEELAEPEPEHHEGEAENQEEATELMQQQITHPSIVEKLQDLEVKRCQTCCEKFHCPLCHPLTSRSRSAYAIKTHLSTTHWVRSVKYKGLTMMKCGLECPRDQGGPMDRAHWHCPLCPQIKVHRSRLQEHLGAHTLGKNRAYRFKEAQSFMEVVPDQVEEMDASEIAASDLALGLQASDADQSMAEVQVTDTQHIVQKPQEVFSLVAGLVGFELLDSFVVGHGLLMQSLQEKTGVHCSLQDDQRSYLMQGNWTQVAEARRVLQTLSYCKPSTEQDLQGLMRKSYRTLETKIKVTDVDNLHSADTGDEMPEYGKCLQEDLSGASQGDRVPEAVTSNQEKETTEGLQSCIDAGADGADLTGDIDALPENDGDQPGETPAVLNEKENANDEEVCKSGEPTLKKSENTCPFCKKYFRLNATLMAHLVQTSCRNRRRKAAPSMPKSLQKAIERMDAVKDKFCPLCNKTFMKTRDAKIHHALLTCMRRTLRNRWGLRRDPSTRMFHCHLCPFSCPVPSKLVEHNEKKHMERTLPCDKCSKMFATQVLLENHARVVHNNTDMTVCHVCGNEVKSVYYKRHVKEHSASASSRLRCREPIQLDHEVTCSQCQFSTRYQDRLRRHLKNVHGEKTKMCDVCGLKFALTGTLNQHRKNTHGIYPSKSKSPHESCPHCHKKMLKKNLAAHIKLTHQGVRNYMCKMCNKAFQTKFVLECHLQTHIKAEDRKYKFLCQFCGAGFTNKLSYRDHLNIHTGERPYKCEVCSFSFKQKNVYLKHLEVHKEIRYMCEICHEPYNTRHNLVKHMRKHSQLEGAVVYYCSCGEKFLELLPYRAHMEMCDMALKGVQQQGITDEDIKPLLFGNQDMETVILVQSPQKRPSAAESGYLVITQDPRVNEDKAEQQTVVVLSTPDGGQQEISIPTSSDECTLDLSKVIQGAHGVSIEDFISQTGPGLHIAQEPVIEAIDEDGTEMDSQQRHIQEVFSEADLSLEPVHQDGKVEVPTDLTLDDSDGDDLVAGGSNTESADNNGYLCGYCQQLFENISEIHGHILAEHGEHLPGSGGDGPQTIELQLHYDDTQDGGAPQDIQLKDEATSAVAGDAALL